jgi:hypothetical protein
MENTNLTPKLIEKMICLEQGIASSGNKFLSYDKTDYYLRLTPEKKKEYKGYLKNKGKKKVGWLSLGILPFFLLALMNISLTGNVIKDNLGENNVSFVQLALFVSAILVIILGLYFYFSNKSSDNKFKKHALILEESVSEKYSTKR